MDTIFHIGSTFIDSFTGLMPYFLLGLLASALVEIYFDTPFIQKIIKQRFLSLLIFFLATFLIPVAKGGIIPFAHRLYKKGVPIYTVLFILTSAPLINIFTISNSITALGWGDLVMARIIFGVLVAVIIGLIFWFISKIEPNPAPKMEIEKISSPRRQWGRLFSMLLNDLFEWLPMFIFGCFLAALLRTLLPLSIWMNSSHGFPYQILTAMLYSVILSISSTVDVFVVLNWLGKFPTAAILAFLLAGGLVDIRGIMMMIKGFGLKITFFWTALVLVLVFIGSLSFHLLING